MESKANPICERGERNIFCPLYNGCPDYAVKASWESWNCSQCKYKAIKHSITGCEYELNEPDPCYDIPSIFAHEIGIDSFDEK
jgi:hypothetical protein